MSNETEVFTDWILEYAEPSSVLVEVGPGSGDRSTYTKIIATADCSVLGVDPDPRIRTNAFCQQIVQSSIERFADVSVQRFKIIYSCQVLEHIEKPTEFFQAIRKLLLPGGSLFCITGNLYHYFGLVAKLSERLHFQEQLTQLTRGRDYLQNVHHPTHYRANTIPKITRLLLEGGFSSVEFKCYDLEQNAYLPHGLKWFHPIYRQAVYLLQQPQYMWKFMFRAEA